MEGTFVSCSRQRLIAVAAAALIPFALTLPARVAHGRNLLVADGPGGTYELIRTAYTTELPDCGHMVDHITEAFDDELKKNVFVFHAHVNQDDDRCGGTDRQRTEIRARAADIVANNGETLYYRWKFKLATGFQGSNRFTHIFQIKSDLGAPIMTLTPRVSTFGITGRAAGNSQNTDLAKLVGVWVVVDLKVLYSDNGRIELNIRRLKDGQMLYSHAGAADMWDANASGHDSKFGIYRSLESKNLLRDEQVRFADFCASKVSAKECEDDGAPPPQGGGGAGGTDAGALADAGSGGASGTGGASGGSGGASAGTGGTAGTSGGTGGTGGSSTTSPPRDAGGSGRADAGPSTEPSTAEPEPAPRTGTAGGCSLGASTDGVGRAAALWVLITGLTLLRRRRR